MTDHKSIGSSRKYSGPNWAYDLSGWPINWLEKARELDRAAQLIFRSVEDDYSQIRQAHAELKERPDSYPSFPYKTLLDTFVFLASLSIENLLKGMLVREDPKLISEGKLKGDLITRHDLPLFASKLGLVLSEEEKQFLEIGKTCIVSWGRYPISKNIGGFESSRTINTRIEAVYGKLYERLASDLERDSKPRFRE